MFPVIQLGPLALQAPGLIILISIWLGLTASEKVAPRKGLSVDMLYNLIFVPLVIGSIAARLAFVMARWDSFSANWLSALALDPRLLDPWAGIGAASITALAMGQRNKLTLWPTLDALTPFFAVLAIGLWCAALSAGTAFGAETALPWGIQLWGAPRHPTQIYGLIGAVIGLAVVYRSGHQTDGILFLRFAALSAATLLIVEGFRADSVLIGSLRVIQIAAWLALSACFYWLDRKSRRANG
jgi:phosphatidylglycerol:prolipoprotein diacylglycerol transferase